MSDFLTTLTTDDAPEAHQVTIKGETGTVWFRRINAGERANILKGQKVSHVVGTGGTVEVDLGENENQKHLLVLYSVCKEDGKPFFKTLQEVRKLVQYKLNALYDIAVKVNREDEEDLGKS